MEIGRDQYMQAAVRLMTEAARYEAKTRRPLERLAVSYFWKWVHPRFFEPERMRPGLNARARAPRLEG